MTGQYSWSHEFRGRDAILNGLMGHFRSFFAERPRTVAFNFIADGDYVVVEARGDNVTKAGLRYDNQYCLVFRIENGKIKQIKEYCDSTLVETRARAVSGSAQACGGLAVEQRLRRRPAGIGGGNREPCAGSALAAIAAMLAPGSGCGETAAGSGVNSPS